MGISEHVVRRQVILLNYLTGVITYSPFLKAEIKIKDAALLTFDERQFKTWQEKALCRNIAAIKLRVRQDEVQ